MGQPVLILFANGTDYEALLRLSTCWHAAYCERHHWRYLEHCITPNTGRFDCKAMAFIDFVKSLSNIEDGTVVASIGADMLIVRPEVDLLAALGDYDIAVHGNAMFCNEGFIVVRNTSAVRALLLAILEKGPMSSSMIDISYRVHDVFSQSVLKIKRLDDRWNWYDCFGCAPKPVTHPRSSAVIVGWHGQPLHKRIEAMKATLETMNQKVAS